ncbi:hypothetical protein RJD38_13805 [Vibrio scophthalmi]|uniref:Lipoprotein n=1 Tax=Vibrio scophthalmi TaxID=45658 RepID=A0A1C7FAN2_9VIBR|nr:hypothetical protein [Vibrio scophthalmi]ANU36503.1 hypothetical protein VSVS05_01376 [Vibrio scophthalmi]
MRIYAIGLITPFVLSGCGGDSASDDTSVVSSTSNLTNSSACFNSELHQIDTEVITTYAEEIGHSSTNVTEHTRVAGPVSYNGHNNVITIEEVGTNNTTYLIFDDSVKSVRTLAQRENGTETKYLPDGIVLEYALDKNETRTYPTVSVTESGVNAGTKDMTLTFIKSESITVPAGTFDTCKFQLTINGTEADGSSYETVFDQNIGIGSGITIRDTWTTTTDSGASFSGSDTLISATVNGNAI